MDILINRFTLRHNGIEYMPGDVLEIDDATGHALVARSKGAIIEIVKSKKAQADKISKKQESQDSGTDKMEMEDGTQSEEDNQDDRQISQEESAQEEMAEKEIALPNVDPAQAVSAKSKPSVRQGKRK